MMGAVELRQIQYFVVVARQQSFSRAAEAVGVAQPALSQQMKRLEAELGVTPVSYTHLTLPTICSV